MDVFLTARYQTLESLTDIRSSTTRKNNSNRKSHSFESPKLHNYQTNVSSNPPRKCTICEFSHPLRLCLTFLKMTKRNITPSFIVLKLQILLLRNNHIIRIRLQFPTLIIKITNVFQIPTTQSSTRNPHIFPSNCT